MKDIKERILKTFIEGFLGALAITLPSTDLTNIAILKSVLIGAVSAGLSAVINLTLNSLNKKED